MFCIYLFDCSSHKCETNLIVKWQLKYSALSLRIFLQNTSVNNYPIPACHHCWCVVYCSGGALSTLTFRLLLVGNIIRVSR